MVWTTDRGPINLSRHHLGRADRPLEEPVGGVSVSSGGHEHIDHLAELVDRSIDVAPPAGDLHIRLVDLPAVTDGMPTRPSGVGQQRREPQHPAVDRDVVDLDPALGQQLLDVAVGQAEAQLPADREDDDIKVEAEAGKGGPRSGRARVASSHPGSLAARTRSPRMQQYRTGRPGVRGRRVAILVVGTLLAFASAGRSCWALRS